MKEKNYIFIIFHTSRKEKQNPTTTKYLADTLDGDVSEACNAHLPDRTSAIPPQALGEDIDVPFISCVPRNVQFGTDAIAPPGALILTPRAPSVLVKGQRKQPH